MKKYLVIIICTVSLAFMVVISAQETPVENSSNIPNAKSNVMDIMNKFSIHDISNPKIVEEGPYFQIVKGDNQVFHYYIYDEDMNVVTEGGGIWYLPEISMVNDNLVKFRRHMGTGISTSFTFYYDAKKDVFSRTFHSVYDETDELIVYSYFDKLIVRDIFDRTAYYREITEFPHELADVVEPFVDVEFADGNEQIEVQYLTEDGSTCITDLIDLPE